MTHHPLSPSGAARWMECTASVHLGASANALGLGGGSGKHALAGTAAMRILQRMLPAPDGTLGMSFKDASTNAALEGAIDVTEVEADMQEALEFAASKLLEVTKAADWWGVEHPVDIPQVPSRGTADFIATRVRPGCEWLHVADYKHGTGIEVNPERNPQLMLYAAGHAASLGWARSDIPVTLSIIQPRHERGGMRVWNTLLGDVFAFAELAAERAAAHTYRTGPHCRYCSGVPLCGLRINELEEAARLGRECDPVHDATGDVMSRVLRLGHRVTELVTMTRSAAIARLLGGRPVPGFRLKEGPGKQVWKPEALKSLEAAYGENAFNLRAHLSPAQVRDTLPDGKAFVAAWAYRRPGNPTLETTEVQNGQ